MNTSHDWYLKGFTDGVNQGVPRYRIMLELEPYLSKGILTEDDRMVIDEALTERDTPPEIMPEMPQDMLN